MPPTFGILAALTPQRHSITFMDDRIQNIDFDESYDLVGISIYTRSAPRAYQIADEFRKRGTRVVLGGWHASALPEEAKCHADSVVIGEAEETWPQLLKDLDNGTLNPIYKQERPVDPGIIPPAKSIISSKRYSIGIIQATRGCPYRCNFCAMTNRRYGRMYRLRPVENVLEEIRALPQKIIFFGDNSLTINTEYTKQLFKNMKELNKKFYCNGNVNGLNHDDELLKLAKEAGCKMWNIGFESVSQETINSIGKRSNKIEDYASTVRKIHDFGMVVNGNFIFGFDTDQKNIFDRTLEAVYDWGIDLCSFLILTPLPGTPLFDRLDMEGNILTRDWSKYDYSTAVHRPKNMSPEELEEGTLKINGAFNSNAHTMKNLHKSMKLGFYPFLLRALPIPLKMLKKLAVKKCT